MKIIIAGAGIGGLATRNVRWRHFINNKYGIFHLVAKQPQLYSSYNWGCLTSYHQVYILPCPTIYFVKNFNPILTQRYPQFICHALPYPYRYI